MSIPFNASTPQAAQTVAQTQPLLLQNNSSIGTVFNNTNTGGNFTQYLMQNVAAALSGGSLPSNPMGIWHMVNGANTFSGVPIPYFANSAGDYPLLPDLKTAPNTFGFKIGNIIVNYGKVSGSSNTLSITYSIPFTSSTSYALLGMPNNGGSFNEGQWTSQANSGSTGQLRRGSGTSGSVVAYYIAIGT